MKPLRPTLLAQQIRNICNNWPSFAHVKSTVLAEQAPDEDIDPDFGAEEAYMERVIASRDKYAYLQSLDQPTSTTNL